MSKEKRAADLDAELAALEAELAALEAGSPKKAPKPKKPAAPPPGSSEAPRAPPGKKFGLPFGKKKPAADAAPAAAAPAPSPIDAQPAPEPVASSPASTPPPAAATPADALDLTLWRQEGTTWIRTLPSPKRTLRRVLDEDGAFVREESVSRSELDRVDAVKAERGMGRLFRRKSA